MSFLIKEHGKVTQLLGAPIGGVVVSMFASPTVAGSSQVGG